MSILIPAVTGSPTAGHAPACAVATLDIATPAGPGAIAEHAAALVAHSSDIRSLAGEFVLTARDVHDSVGGLATALEELTATGRTIAEQVRGAHDVVETAGNQVRVACAGVDALHEALTEISKVVELIASIARKTNLLALNAAIEAARAGEAGRSFAVLAQEVKDLSVATQDATRRAAAGIAGVRSGALAGIDGVSTINGTVSDLRERFSRVAEALMIQVSSTSEIAATTAETARLVGLADRQSKEITELGSAAFSAGTALLTALDQGGSSPALRGRATTPAKPGAPLHPTGSTPSASTM